MYLSILKKDLKRKRTMNIILLIFIILAATFISSSVNNLISISVAVDHYFEKAELKDYVILAIKEEQNDKAIADFLNKDKNVKNWVVDENLFISDNNIKLHNGKKFTMSTSGMISSYHINQQKFFDSKNETIKKIHDGEIYLPTPLMENNHLNAGDVITISGKNYSKNFEIVGNCKDALLGSTMAGTARFLINDNDYNEIKNNTKFTQGEIFSVNSSDVDKLKQDYNKMNFNAILAADQKLISTSYIMDMMIAALLLVVSICLILISLIILRFTIVFTLNEEFREIGVMKAIGIKERKIRGLYIIKYLAISTIGCAIGFLCSIPFGNMFIDKVSKNMIISNDSGVLINLIFSIIIIFIVILFCYSCTNRINKFSPIDAIRNGSNGERFKRKGFLRLNKSRFSTILFMAWNDILSEPKKFGSLVLTFTIGIILIIVPINTINTLRSDKLVKWFGMAESDVYLVNENQQMKFVSNGSEYTKDYIHDLQNKLNHNGIDASVFVEMIFKFHISKGDNNYNSIAMQGIDITTDQYTYTRGLPPKYENEIALTHITADKIGAKIGDTIKITTGKKEKEYIVTAIFQSMNNLGDGIRFSEKAKLDYRYAYGGFGVQVKYKDNPTKKEKEVRFEKMKKLFPEFQVDTGGEYINKMIGNIAGMIEGVKRIIVLVVIIINMLVAILMVKTFLVKEKGEIGMLKSIGFRNTSIMQWQVFRIGIILLISTILGAILSHPIAQISSGKVFEMMGASHIEFSVNPFEVYVIYPLLVFTMTMIASTITALQINKVSTQETNNIE